VPMVARRRVFGTLICASACERRRYTRAHLEAVTDLAHRIALALDNEQLLALAQNASRAREELLALLSRDLRTPLTSIIAAATRALQAAPTNEPATTVLRNARRMEGQIRDLLDYAQLEAGSLRIELRKERLADLLKRTVEASQQQAGKHSLELEIDADVRESEVACDPGRIRQVVSALVEHALRVSKPASHIGVRLSDVEGELQITVQDAAQSMNADQIARLFECSRHVAGQPHDDAQPGLRLCIARGLVEAHGGHMWIETHPRGGNAYHFTLRSSSPQALAPGLGMHRPILLVDSDLAFRRELQEILTERGYRVETADNGWQAWNYLQANPPPALILLDLMMPVMDGWELHAAIKSHPELASVPTVIVSGLDRYRIEASLSDAQGYIEKPIRTAQLFEVVQRHVSSPAPRRAQSIRPESSL
jgi:signal transduction histidine kinase/ActR/RegA family two-component response regulator